MTGAPAAATISVADTIVLLDAEFAAFAEGVAEGRYAFWLGSGISFDRFPGLKTLVTKVLEYLRGLCDPANPACRYHEALEQAFAIATLTADERAAIDLTQAVESWPASVTGALQDRLSGHYASLLNIEIEGEANDALVWGGIDVVATYADDAVDPDAEHLCLAMLVKEGLIEELASANWDGLIEKAVETINGRPGGLDVCVRSEDLQGADQRAKLIKFHGCAVRAGRNEADYRPYIVGRQCQLDAWLGDPKMQGLIEHLKSVAIERPTLMLGLSAQDFNIRGLFNAAKNALQWDWPGQRPAYVFAENTISEGQRSLLECVYGENYRGTNRQKIKESAHIQAFAKPLLLGLVLYCYGAKLARLKALGDTPMNGALDAWTEVGIKVVRDQIAKASDGNHYRFTKDLIRLATHTRMLFARGRSSDDPALYEPVTGQPVSQMAAGLEIATSGLPEASVAVALLGQGAAAGDWSLRPPDPDDGKAGTGVLETVSGPVKLFVLSSAHAEEELYASGRLEDQDNAILIHAEPLYDRLARSPRKAPGRTGAVRPRRVSIKTLLAEEVAPEELMDQFKLETGL